MDFILGFMRILLDTDIPFFIKLGLSDKTNYRFLILLGLHALIMYMHNTSRILLDSN